MPQRPSITIGVTALALLVSVAATYFTYTVALTPFDQPNLVIAPFLPGVFSYALLHGFASESLPAQGFGAAFIAGINGLFYAIFVYALYVIYKKIYKRRIR